MSYLNPTRVHFAGLFRADVSTVNNEDLHFDSATFVPKDQDYGDSTNNGWWQPSGTGAWRLCGCTITGAAWDGKFASTSTGDHVIGLPLKNSSDRVDAKIVDLDPDQQLVSMIFGLEVRIADPVSGAVLMTGELTPVPFMDIWRRGGEGCPTDPRDRAERDLRRRSRAWYSPPPRYRLGRLMIGSPAST